MTTQCPGHYRRNMGHGIFADAGVAADERTVADAPTCNDRIVTGNGVAVHDDTATGQCQVLRHRLLIQPRIIANTSLIPADGIIIEPGVVVALRQVGFALHITAKRTNRHILPHLPQCTDAVQFRVDGMGSVGDLVLLVEGEGLVCCGVFTAPGSNWGSFTTCSTVKASDPPARSGR